MPNHFGLLLLCTFLLVEETAAFLCTAFVAHRSGHGASPLADSIVRLGSSMSSTTAVEDYLAQNHNMFWNMIMQKNESVWKKLRESDQSPTMFAPTDEAMQSLGDKKLQQLTDVRNEETVLRMGSYHAIKEPVSAADLFDSGGVMTVMGDVVPVERSVAGGMFGVGGKEDGGVLVGGARVVETVILAGNCIVHRTDDLVSPSILWRYCDQLRIPGSK